MQLFLLVSASSVQWAFNLINYAQQADIKVKGETFLNIKLTHRIARW